MFKKVLMHTRRTLKIAILLIIALFLIALIVASFYRLGYSVSINDNLIGYTYNKRELQEKISEYLNGNDDENVAFVAADNLPEYKLCLIKKGTDSCDDETFDKIKESGVNYYRYYAILENQEEKYYVRNFADAEKIVNELKEKNSANIDTVTISEKYETELKEMADTETVVSALYVEPKPAQVTVASSTSKTLATVSKTVNTSRNMSGSKANLGVSLIRPVQGIVSSRFGERSSVRSGAHTGLDLATSIGTPIHAAASGTVTFAGRQGSYGLLIVITHSNGVQTYYGHCSKLYVSAGQSVSQGETIGAVGNTGNSTGPHLHFEVRVNGTAYNPQNYV